MAHQHLSSDPPASDEIRSRPSNRQVPPTSFVVPASMSAPTAVLVVVAAVTGAGLFALFTVSDGAGLLPAAAVVAYWALFGATYLVLGTPGRDWRLPVTRAHLTQLVGWAWHGAGRSGAWAATLMRRVLRLAERRFVGRARPSRVRT